jgi:hypothetical protein
MLRYWRKVYLSNGGTTSQRDNPSYSVKISDRRGTTIAWYPIRSLSPVKRWFSQPCQNHTSQVLAFSVVSAVPVVTGQNYSE